MKKLMSVILTLVLIGSTCSVGMAEIISPLNAQEIRNARTLIAMEGDSAVWKEDDTPSASMNALQAQQYLSWLLSDELDGLMGRIQDSAQLIELSKTGSASGIRTVEQQVQRFRNRISANRDELEQLRLSVYNDLRRLETGNPTEREKRRIALRVREDMTQMQRIISGISSQYAKDASVLAQHDLTFESVLQAADLPDGALTSAAQSQLTAEAERLTQEEQRWLDAQNGVDFTVLALSSKQFGFVVRDEAGKPLPGVSVSLSCSGNPRKSGTATTDSQGLAVFMVKDYLPDGNNKVTVDVVIKKDWYCTREMRRLRIRGGSSEVIRLERYRDQPFLRMAMYNSSDILSQQNSIFYTPKNNAMQQIEILIDSFRKKPISGFLYLCYRTVDENGKMKDAEERRSFTSGTSTIFTGQYAQLFAPGTEVSVRIEAAGLNKTYETQLKIEKAIVEEPMFQDGAMSFTTGGLELNIPSSIPFIGGSALSLDIPAMPAQLMIDPTGYVRFAFGKEYQSEELSWKKESLKEATQRMDDADKQDRRDANAVDNQVYRNTGATDRMKVFGDVTAAVTVFAGLQGRITPDVTAFKIDGSAGVQAAFKGGYGWQFLVGGAIPMFVALDMLFSIGSTFGLGLSANLPNLSNMKFEFGNGQGITVDILTELGVSAGIGVRNLMHVALRFFGNINPKLRLNKVVSAAVSLSMGVDVTAQFFLAKWKEKLWEGSFIADSKDYNGAANQALPASKPMTAITESGVVKAASSAEAAPINNAGSLKAETEAMVFSRLDSLSRGIRFVTLTSRDGKKKATFGLFIKPVVVAGQDRKAELVWYNLDEPASCGKFYPSRNGDTWRGSEASDYAFDVAAQNNLLAVNILSGTFEIDAFGQTAEKPSESQMTLAMMRLSSDGKRLELAEPAEGSAYQANALAAGGGRYLLNMPTIYLNDNTQTASPCELWFASAGCNVEEEGDGRVYHVEFADFQSVSNGQGQARIELRPFYSDFPDGSDQYAELYTVTRNLKVAQPYGAPGWNNSLSCYYRLYATCFEGSRKEKETTLRLIVNKKRYTLDHDVVFFEPLVQHGANTDAKEYLFYLKKGQADDGSECYRLMGAQRTILPNGENKIAIRDYDVPVYADHFQIATLQDGSKDGMTYLYWTECVSDGTTGEKTYRVKCVRFERGSNTMSAPFPLLELTYMPNSLSILPDGTGYYTTEIERNDDSAVLSQKLYKFSFSLKTDITLTGVAAYDPCVCAGEYATLLFAVKNTGNLPISRFGITLREQGKTKALQTILVDCRNPQNGSVNDLFGTNAADSAYSVNRVDSIFDDENGDTWMMTTREINSAQNGDEIDFNHTDLLMPGDVHTYQAVFKVPEDWSGQKKLTAETAQLYALVQYSISNAANGVEQEIGFDEQGNLLQASNAAGGIRVTRVQNASQKQIGLGNGDLMMDCQPYIAPDGAEYVRVNIVGRSETSSSVSPTLTAELDGRTVLSHCFRNAIDEDFGYTLDIPASQLLMGRNHGNVTFTITDHEAGNEFATFDNRRTVTLGNAMMIVQQPVSLNVLEGSDVFFEVAVSGGIKPYRYQWQKMDQTGRWVNIRQADKAVLSLSAVSIKDDDLRGRCVVHDSTGDEVISDVAVLSVWQKLPQTGDHQQPLGLAVLLMASAALLAAGWRKKKMKF